MFYIYCAIVLCNRLAILNVENVLSIKFHSILIMFSSIVDEIKLMNFIFHFQIKLGITPCGTRGAPSGVFKKVSMYIDWITANTGIRPS
jgi:hypothetical protein